MEHITTISPIPMQIDIPFVFGVDCLCGWHFGPNAPKWVFLAIQAHWIEKGLTNKRGLLPPADQMPIPEKI